MALDHALRVLAGIIPNRKDHLLYALQHLTEEHFRSEPQRVLFKALDRYFDIASDVLPAHVFEDLLANSKSFDASKALLFETAFGEASSLQIPDHEFRYSVDALKDQRAEQMTGEAITLAFEIFARGAEVGKDRLEGHREARQYAYEALTEIDKLDSIESAPEGNMMHEGKDFISEYMDRKEGKVDPGVLTGIAPVDKIAHGFGRGELTVVAAFTNAGKASPLWTPVLTPAGWRQIRDLEVGDVVVDPDTGGSQEVTGVFDRGEMNTYRVKTADGGSVLTAGDHLWEFQLFQDRYFGTRSRRVESTLDIKEHLRKNRRVFLPLPKPIEFDPAPDLPVDPYTLGALLGDGSFRMNEVRFSVHPDDTETLNRMKVPGEWVRTSRSSDWRLRGGMALREDIKALGLWGLESHDEFAPLAYMRGKSADRLALLQGLMDTDGTIAESGKGAELCLSSETLIRQVVELVHSLGGSVGRTRRKTTTHRDAWRVSILHLPDGMNPFRLERKAKKWNLRKRNYGFRRVVSVEHVGAEEVRCISVSSPRSLYITEDFLVTHNTQFCCQTAWSAAVEQGKNVFFATTETVRTTVRRRIIARHSRLPQFGLPRGLDTTDLKNGSLSPGEELALKAVVDDLDNNPAYGRLHIAQIPRGATLSYLEARMKRQAAQWQIDLALMDYLALLKSDRKRTSEREEMNEVIKDAKVFATSFDDGRGVPFITPWQIRRESHTEALRTGAYGLSSLSDTAEIEKSADQILAFLRMPENPGELSMQFLKMRDGEIPKAMSIQTDFRNAYFTAKEKSAGFGAASGSVDTFSMGKFGL